MLPDNIRGVSQSCSWLLSVADPSWPSDKAIQYRHASKMGMKILFFIFQVLHHLCTFVVTMGIRRFEGMHSKSKVHRSEHYFLTVSSTVICLDSIPPPLLIRVALFPIGSASINSKGEALYVCCDLSPPSIIGIGVDDAVSITISLLIPLVFDTWPTGETFFPQRLQSLVRQGLVRQRWESNQ